MSKTTLDDLLPFDKRVMHRFVNEGKMTQEDAKKYLENLPDMAEQCVDISDEIYEDNKEELIH